MTRILTLLVLASLTIGQVGCGCHRPFLSWFNRGDSCETCAPPDCVSAPAGVPQGAVLQMPSLNDQIFGGDQVVGAPIVTDGVPARSRMVYEALPQPR
jgi:hypothetical protein